MYTEKEFKRKVKEWLLEEKLNPIGCWSIQEDSQSNNSVCISVEISDELIINKDDNKEINIPLSSSSPAVIDDDEHLKKAVLVLYHSVLDQLNKSFKIVFGE